MNLRQLRFVILGFLALVGQITHAGYPTDIQEMLDVIKRDAVEYPDRRGDVAYMKDGLANGDFGSVRYAAKDIIEKQRNLRVVQNSGLPTDIREMLNAIEREAVEYPDRRGDVAYMKDGLANGDFDSARYAAKSIVEKQRSLRAAQEQPLPADIREMLNVIEREAVEYSDRRGDVAYMKDGLANADFDSARYAAKDIIEKQRNLRAAQEKGPPADIQELLDVIKREAVEYPDRHGDVAYMKDGLADGDFGSARYAAKDIIEKQRNLRVAQNSGLPADIQEMLNVIEREAVEYPDRRGDIAYMKDGLANGDFDSARYAAKDIIEKQRNLRAKN